MSEISPTDYPVRHRIRVRYSEIDAQGVVFNAHYLTYFDTCLNEAFRQYDINWLAKVQESGCDVQLVKSLVEYKRPLKFDEDVEVCARIGRLGKSSITWTLAIFGPAGDLRATGEIVWVYAHLSDHRAEPLPEWIRQAMEPLL